MRGCACVCVRVCACVCALGTGHEGTRGLGLCVLCVRGEVTLTGRDVHDVDMDGGTACLDGTPTRRADLVGVEAVELEPPCDELVDYWCRDLRLRLCARAVIPDLRPPKIVGEDMDDVGLPGGGGADEEKGGEADVLGNHEQR